VPRFLLEFNKVPIQNTLLLLLLLLLHKKANVLLKLHFKTGDELGIEV
jgi:hypothetical protein